MVSSEVDARYAHSRAAVKRGTEEGAHEDQEVQAGEGEQDPLEHVAPYRARPGPRPPQAVTR
jgi:hypothetical protein